jgi:hypothetical protein
MNVWKNSTPIDPAFLFHMAADAAIFVSASLRAISQGFPGSDRLNVRKSR